jgi:ADP-ribose pyrophosphatase YjhB (NUDIX family)
VDELAAFDEVRAIARTGLHYSENPFDRERYERLLTIAVDGYAEHSTLDRETIRARFDAEVGYVTARVGADGAVFDDADRCLLVRRADDDKWGLVAGWVDPNESPEFTIVRELAEEAGVVARVEQLVGVFHRPAHPNEHPHGIVSVLFLCSIVSGALRAQLHEVTELAFRDIDELAADEWHHHHSLLAHAARDAHWRRKTGV